MLWLCLHFPALPLEIFSRAEADESPWVITEGDGARRCVAICNATARERGIRPGMTLSAAHGLAHDLQARAHDGAAERRALEALAAWSGRFTSFVSLLPPRSLLLEIAGSLRLFDGLPALSGEIRTGLAALGYRGTIGIAPVPQAAALFARAGDAPPVTDREALRGALHDIPLDLLELDRRRLRILQDMGLRRLGELLRLPRADLARRLGRPTVDELDRLTGARPDPREPWRPPDRFEHRLELPAEITDTTALAFPAHRLLLDLEGFLQRRAAGAQRLDWTLEHDRAPPTTLALGLVAPGRDPRHLLGLLRERLARLELAHPVSAISLRVTRIRPLVPRAPTLDGGESPRAEDWPRLVETLRARLGDEAVQGLRCLADHRPERAWQPCPPGTADPGTAPASHRRPLWLLAEPLAIGARGSSSDALLPLPQGGEPLALESGPERIESGWWEGKDAARDYYIARDAGGAHYWVFRERRGPRRWFLHGFFA